MLAQLRNMFLRGLIVSLPIIVTIYIVIWVISFFDNFILVALLPNFLRNIPGLGFILSILVMILIGFITKNYLGNFFVELMSKFLNRIPLIKTIYSTLKQVFDTMLSNNSKAFRDAVLVQYPSKGIWVLGFITGDVHNEIKDHVSKTSDVQSVFVPSTPNPTSGFLIFVPKTDIVMLNMKTDAAMKLIISGGIVKEEIKKENIV